MNNIKDDDMTDQSRVWKVLLILLVSMTGGAVVLMAMGNHPPNAGAFSLSSYYKLAPTDEAIQLQTSQAFQSWHRIEVSYSGTQIGSVEKLAILNGLADASQLNTHFVVCNGCGGQDGQIQSTWRWQNQRAAYPQQNWGQPHQTICITVVADGPNKPATDYQIRRTSALIETLCHKLHINPGNIHWPGEIQ